MSTEGMPESVSSVRASNEGEVVTAFSEAAGVVSIARIDRAPPANYPFD
jgi:hypothetical protein